MSDRIDQLEYTVMELGAEMFRLKQELSHISSMKENILSVLKKLQLILDEKGIIDSEEFDIATSLQQFLSPIADNLEDLDEDRIPNKHDLH